MNKQAQIIIKGRVQGVFFRDFTRENATKLGLNGWVRNLPAGSVEAVVEGEEEKILKLVELLRKGPPSAQVKEVNIDWLNYEGKFNDFSIRW